MKKSHTLILMLGTLGGLLGAHPAVRAANPTYDISFTPGGELILELDGKTITNTNHDPGFYTPTVRFRPPEAEVRRLWGNDGTQWPSNEQDSRWTSSNFDADKKQLAQTFPWGEVVRTYKIVSGGVDMEVTVHNKSENTLFEFQQRLFALQVPVDTAPVATTEAVYFGQAVRAMGGDTLSGPVALPMVIRPFELTQEKLDNDVVNFTSFSEKTGSVLVASTRETTKQLALSWLTDSYTEPWDRKKPEHNDPVAQDLAQRAHVERAEKGENWWLQLSIGGDRVLYHERFTSRPIPPGGTDTYQISLRFGSAADPLAPVDDLLKAYGKARPMQFEWKDRRPIIPSFMGDWFPYHDPIAATLTKPTDIQPSDEFRERVMAEADKLIAKMKEINAQGVIVWNIEGNSPSVIKYVGDPHMIEYMCPEADAVADEFFQKIRDAGFKVGVCLRPSVLLPGKIAEFPHIAPGAVDPKSPYAFYHDYPHAKVSPADILSKKVEYAKKRWGCTLFYVDTNVGAGFFPEGKEEEATWPKWPAGDFKWYNELLDENVWAEVLRRNPGVLFTIEHTPLIQYTVNAPFDEWSGTGTPAVVRATWPDAFKCLVIKEPKDHWEVAEQVRRGDILFEGGEFARVINQLGEVLRLGPPKELTGKKPDQLLAIANDPNASEQMRFFAAKQLSAGKVDAEAVTQLLSSEDRLVQLIALDSLDSSEKLTPQIPTLLTFATPPLLEFFNGPLRDASKRGGPEFIKNLIAYAGENPAAATAVVNMVAAAPGADATAGLAAIIKDENSPIALALQAASLMGWRKDATPEEKDVTLNFLITNISVEDRDTRAAAATHLHRSYWWGHGLWHNDPRVQPAVEAAAAEERKKPEPWTDLLALFDKIIKKQE